MTRRAGTTLHEYRLDPAARDRSCDCMLRSARRAPGLFERLADTGSRGQGVLLGAADQHVGVRGTLVRRADAGEVLQLARTRPRVEALRVALLGDLDRRVHVDLDEPQPGRLVQLARERAIVVGGGDERRDRHRPGVGHQPRDVRDAADVLRPVGGGEREVAREPVAQVVAVEEVGGVAVLHQDALERGRDGRLARGRQPGQPHGRAARAERVPALAALEAALVPGDAGGVLCARPPSRTAPHHAGADGVVGVLVDQDERARRPVRRVRVGDDRRAHAQRDAGDVVELELVRRALLGQRRHVEQRVDRLHRGADRAGGVLERDVLAGPQRVLRHPAHRGLEVAAGDRELLDAADHLAAPDVEVVRELDADGVRRRRRLERPVVRLDGEDRGARARRQHDDFVARRAPCRRPPGPRSGARRARRPGGSPTAPAGGAGPRRGGRRRRPARGARAAAVRRTSPPRRVRRRCRR